MGDFNENLLKAVKHYQNNLDKYVNRKSYDKMLHCIDRLSNLPIRVTHLEQTGVGKTVNALRKIDGKVGEAAKVLITQWKRMVVGEQEQEQYEDEEEDEDDDDIDEGIAEDAGDLLESSSSEEDREGQGNASLQQNLNNPSSVNRNDRTDNRNDSEQGPSKQRKTEGNSEEERRHKSRKIETSSEEERRKHKSHSKVEEKTHKKSNSDEERKHKSHKKAGNSSDEESHKSSKHKRRHEEDEDSHQKAKERKKKKHDEERNSKQEKSKSDSKHKKDKHKKEQKKKDESTPRHKTDKEKKKSLNNGVGSDMGSMSFAEALDMCTPSSSKSVLKSRKPEKASSSKEKSDVPKLLKEPTLEPIDINLSSLLPPITPNYRPLGNIFTLDGQSKRNQTDYDQLSSIIASKTQRTKVYSGNKTGWGKVPTLFELCIRVLQDNIDALEYTGGIPYLILKPILDKATPNQLFVLEHHNPYLIEDTDDLWRLHCQKDFRNKKPEELESWREMYMRCLDEREAKLKALTANIKQSQDKSLPVRTTKLAYVDDVAKPPRNIAKRQKKNGTGFDKKPVMTPSARLTSLATSGEAGKVAVPNPGARAVERANHTINKPKKAPLMLKSLSLLKNRFRR